MTFLKPVIAALALFVAPAAAHAHTVTKGDIAVDHPWARSARGPVGAVYLVIRNEGATNDRLLAAASDKAESVEIHEHAMSDGVMRMRPVQDGVPLPADGIAVFEPRGLHVMLIGLTSPLVEGEGFPVTLTFENAGDLTVDVDVLSADGADGNHGEHGGH